ncbi:unnamed protein product [Dicrocoelium dendriticum]|nr:unnamed protein product [Dicrocoelium dendriticum]
MSISFEQMQQLLHQQQLQFEKSQRQLFELFEQKLNVQSEPQPAGTPSSVDAVMTAITEFVFNEPNGVTFDSWFKKYEDIFRVELAAQDDAWKVRLLLRKLGAVEHERYINFVLPKNPRDFRFDETVQILTSIFGEQASLFSIRYNCLKLLKRDSHDFITHAGVVNRECERFKLGTMTPDQFKSLIFVCSLQSHADADVRTRILHKLEQEPHLTLQDIAAECQRLINLKHDTKMIENADPRSEPQIYRTAVRGKNVSHRVPNQKPPTACWNCGGWHFVRFCTYKKHLCQKCKRLGHKESHCRKTYVSRPVSTPHLYTNSKSQKTSFQGAKTKVVLATCRTEFAGKRKYLTVKINDVPISLQIDTASDITIISRSSWTRLGKPPLRRTNLTAQNASGEPLRLDGEFTCDIKFKDLSLRGTIYLASCVNINLLGIDWIDRLNLFNVPLNNVCSETNLRVHHTAIPPIPSKTIAEQFQANKMQTKITLLPCATPVFRPRRPVSYASPRTNSDMEAQYNRRYRARRRKFRVGNAVFAASHRGHRISWIPGQVVGRRGKVMYDVRVGRQVWVRHANQLRPRFARIPETRDPKGFDFNELLCTLHPSTSTGQDTQLVERTESEHRLRPQRVRRCVQPLQVDPRRKTYTTTGLTISTRGRC